MSSKVVEADAGIHSLAMAVAVRFFPRCRHALMYMSSFFACLRLNPACHQLALVWYEISFIVLNFLYLSRLLADLWNSTDSIYTERYMNLPALNPGGYINASISNVTAFDKVDYLLAHGSGDDNVHFANSAHLLDMFTKEHIQNYEFRMFTDRCVFNGPGCGQES
jgi:hypothetical protein